MEINTTIGLLAFFVFLTVMFASYAVFAPVVNTRKQKIGTDIFASNDTIEVDPNDSLGKYVRPIVDNILPQLPIKLGEQRRKNLAHIIHTSGNPWKLTPEELIAVQIGLGILGVLAGSLVAIMPLPAAIPGIIFPVFFGVAGAAIPFSKYNSLREQRMKLVEKQLPEAIDLITITVGTAGSTFESGLKSVTMHMPDNLLREEFVRCVTEMESGQTTRDVLTAFYQRFDSKDLESFCKAIIQSKDLGNDPTRTLEQQADFIRTNYEARLERMIARLETTMFIPLIATMLPAFILIFIAPTLVTLSEYLG